MVLLSIVLGLASIGTLIVGTAAQMRRLVPPAFVLGVACVVFFFLGTLGS